MKFWVIGRRGAIAIISLFVLVIGAIIINNSNYIPVLSQARDLPIYCVDKGDEKVASISFDAAWGNGIYGLLI